MATKDGHSSGRHEVLTALPHARPTRRSSKRGAREADGDGSGGEAAAAPTAPGKRTTAAKQPAHGKRPAAKRASARPKAPAAAERGSRAGADSAAAGRTAASASAAEPRVRPPVPPSGYATPRDAPPGGALGPGELVTTTVQAAGELAQVGVTLGVQALRSALRRLGGP
jgi:hypothetical protein